MRLVNARTEQPVASTIELATTRATRRRGLLGRDGLPPGAALVLTPCNAIHTIGMRFPIDVVFVDSRGRVRKVVHNLRAWRMAMSPLSRATIEFAAGGLDAGSVKVGDRLYLTPAAADERSAASYRAAADPASRFVTPTSG
jgi:uncharacterized membrane protein (UPF0127 family)